MLLKELQAKIEFLTRTGHENDLVLITRKEPSVGARAGTSIQAVFAGFDWEDGQVRIEPEIPLISYANNRDREKEVRLLIKDGKWIWKCPVCTEHIRKTFHYCPKCGQKLMLSRS